MTNQLFLAIETDDPDEQAWLTRRLRDELLRTDVNDVEFASLGDAPAGSKSGLEAIDWNTLLITLAGSGSVLAGMVGVLSSWIRRHEGVKVRLTTANGDELVVEGQQVNDELIQRLVAMMEHAPAPAGRPSPGNSAGLPADLYQRLRLVLADTEPFATDAALQDFFVQAPLLPWRTGLPQADSIQSRVDRLIAYLAGQSAGDGVPVLLLFVQLLSANYPDGDGRKRVLSELSVQISAV